SSHTIRSVRSICSRCSGSAGGASCTSRRSSSTELAIGVDENGTTATLIDTVYAGDECGRVHGLFSDADGVRLGRNIAGRAARIGIADVDVVVPGREVVPGVKTQSDVIVAAGIAKESVRTGSQIVMTNRVAVHVLPSIGGVTATADVVTESVDAAGRVADTGGVAKKCHIPDRGVTGTARIRGKRIVT